MQFLYIPSCALHSIYEKCQATGPVEILNAVDQSRSLVKMSSFKPVTVPPSAVRGSIQNNALV